MNFVESKRCRNIRRVLIAMFIICGYMLSTTFCAAVIENNGKESYEAMTALNLAFGAMGEDRIVYRNPVVGGIYIALPFIGFMFMFFDKKSNLKNIVGIICGIVGALSIALPIGASKELIAGIGAVVSIAFYVIITNLSAVSVLFVIDDRNKQRKNAKLTGSGSRLSKHED